MKTRACIVLAMAVLMAYAHSADFAWQEQHAKVLAKGDIEWAPKAFEFVKGASVRYIDFDGGDDSKDVAGATRRYAARSGLRARQFHRRMGETGWPGGTGDGPGLFVADAAPGGLPRQPLGVG